MTITEDQVKAMLAKSDELHKHTEDHLMGIIRKYQSDLGIAEDALEAITQMNYRGQGLFLATAVSIAREALAKIRSENV